MRIALICDDYLPHSTRVSAKMMHELACELLCKGHEPVVICPDDKIKSLDILKLDGVTIYKFPNGSIKDVSKIYRAINESALSFNAWRFVSKHLSEDKIDGIVYYSPSIFFGPLVKKIKQKHRCKSYLILRDSFPQWLVDQKIIKKNGLAEKYFRYFERINYNAADCIGVMSDRNKDIFIDKYSDKYNVQVLFNWANFKSIDIIPHSTLLSKMSLQDKVIFFYGGNIGHAQDMMNLMRLVKSMAYRDDVHFLLVGQGDEVPVVENFILDNSLNNCTYLPSITQCEFKSVLKVVDVGLFSLAKNHSVHNFPGKLLGYMANKLPILGSVNEGNDVMQVINSAKAGFAFVNGNDEALLNAAISLAEDTQLRKNLGNNAFSLLQEKFSVEMAADTILKNLFS
ncbi:glycosyltransferase family 4 protein [Citrobacter freundii]|jgi:O26-antigen biosynthesis N-acetyl-L-fucosamine transferase|uniref:glycosyltransferase family 4 protein n=1 Tax=Citrobacter TaxID=544 RepID=UPI002575B6B1|nr:MULTISPECIES: glycosyltransferase family 4 protein [Citrobacter]MDM3090435.1 glycosyltransferase family 4 protein [Citrobacter sp. Cf133]MDT7441008.1 glycosyltransferase family 4 protein [Citrobacter freundii]MDT9378157.1 glycosyltransferase family 4 protein [Citrobacter freundii]MEB2712206.1 glycosyltransferase family 4 protein [Citrobacter freundii]MEB2759554.1 glycosyltransferase family 4 protein [Citrobacter freundii]